MMSHFELHSGNRVYSGGIFAEAYRTSCKYIREK
jgi:hypothetical protein